MFPQNQKVSPDDIEDLKSFATAVCKNLSEDMVKTLVENFMISCLQMVNMIDEMKVAPHNEDYNKGKAIGLATLVQLYKFIKRNEVAVKALYVIGPEGEPFLYDSTKD